MSRIKENVAFAKTEIAKLLANPIKVIKCTKPISPTKYRGDKVGEKLKWRVLPEERKRIPAGWTHACHDCGECIWLGRPDAVKEVKGEPCNWTKRQSRTTTR